jgi:5-formyltetrahydrofolate cyclo-ligase
MDALSVKRELRKSIIARRDAVSAFDRSRMSDVISSKLLVIDAYEKADLVLAYMNFGSEFETDGFARRVLEDGKTLVLPKLKTDRSGLDLHVVSDMGNLEIGLWGIREPRDGDLIEDFSLVDFVLVPGVAFSPAGDRLGYGGGFYDRLLANKRSDAASVAGAFSFQVVENVPIEENDIPVDGIVTDTEDYFLNRNTQ